MKEYQIRSEGMKKVDPFSLLSQSKHESFLNSNVYDWPEL